MSSPPPLPEQLKNRLVAAGVQDAASLYAALEADPQLHEAYRNWLFTQVFDAFAQTEDREALVALSDEVPLLASDLFLDAVQRAIDTALNMGEYETADALRQRLDALKEIRAMKAYQRQTPLAQAVIAFVQARNESAARRMFELHRDQLDSDAAEQFLKDAFEGSSGAAEKHLQQRRSLLRSLRR